VQNEEFYNLYSSPNIIRVVKPWSIRWVGHVALMGGIGNEYTSLQGKPEEKTPHRKTKRVRKDIIKMDVK
jgi:hypothetical protein